MGTEEKKYNIYYDGQVYGDIDPEVTASELEIIMAQRRLERQPQPQQQQQQQYGPHPQQQQYGPHPQQQQYQTQPQPQQYQQPPLQRDAIPPPILRLSQHCFGDFLVDNSENINSTNDGPRRKTRVKRRRMNQYNSRTIEIQCDRSREDLENNRKSLRRSVSIPGNTVIIPIEKTDAEELEVIVNYPNKKKKTCDDSCEAECRNNSEDSLILANIDDRFSVQIRDSIELLKIKPKRSIEVVQVKLRAMSFLKSGRKTTDSLMENEGERAASQERDSNFYNEMYTKKIESKNMLQNTRSIDENNRSVDYKYRSIDTNSPSMDNYNWNREDHSRSIDLNSRSSDNQTQSTDRLYRNMPNESINKSNPSLSKSNVSSTDSRYQHYDERTTNTKDQMNTYESKTESIHSIANKTPVTGSRNPSMDARSPSIDARNQSIDNRYPSTDNQKRSIETLNRSIETPNRSIDIPSAKIDSRNPSIDNQNANTESRNPSTDNRNENIESRYPSNDNRSPNIDSRSQSIDKRSLNIGSPIPSTNNRTANIDSRNPSIDNRSQHSGQSHITFGLNRSNNEEEQQQNSRESRDTECRCGDPNPSNRTGGATPNFYPKPKRNSIQFKEHVDHIPYNNTNHNNNQIYPNNNTTNKHMSQTREMKSSLILGHMDDVTSKVCRPKRININTHDHKNTQTFLSKENFDHGPARPKKSSVHLAEEQRRKIAELIDHICFAVQYGALRRRKVGSNVKFILNRIRFEIKYGNFFRTRDLSTNPKPRSITSGTAKSRGVSSSKSLGGSGHRRKIIVITSSDDEDEKSVKSQCLISQDPKCTCAKNTNVDLIPARGRTLIRSSLKLETASATPTATGTNQDRFKNSASRSNLEFEMAMLSKANSVSDLQMYEKHDQTLNSLEMASYVSDGRRLNVLKARQSSDLESLNEHEIIMIIEHLEMVAREAKCLEKKYRAVLKCYRAKYRKKWSFRLRCCKAKDKTQLQTSKKEYLDFLHTISGMKDGETFYSSPRTKRTDSMSDKDKSVDESKDSASYEPTENVLQIVSLKASSHTKPKLFTHMPFIQHFNEDNQLKRYADELSMVKQQQNKVFKSKNLVESDSSMTLIPQPEHSSSTAPEADEDKAKKSDKFLDKPSILKKTKLYSEKDNKFLLDPNLNASNNSDFVSSNQARSLAMCVDSFYLNPNLQNADKIKEKVVSKEPIRSVKKESKLSLMAKRDIESFIDKDNVQINDLKIPLKNINQETKDKEKKVEEEEDKQKEEENFKEIIPDPGIDWKDKDFDLSFEEEVDTFGSGTQDENHLDSISQEVEAFFANTKAKQETKTPHMLEIKDNLVVNKKSKADDSQESQITKMREPQGSLLTINCLRKDPEFLSERDLSLINEKPESLRLNLKQKTRKLEENLSASKEIKRVCGSSSSSSGNSSGSENKVREMRGSLQGHSNEIRLNIESQKDFSQRPCNVPTHKYLKQNESRSLFLKVDFDESFSSSISEINSPFTNHHLKITKPSVNYFHIMTKSLKTKYINYNYEENSQYNLKSRNIEKILTRKLSSHGRKRYRSLNSSSVFDIEAQQLLFNSIIERNRQVWKRFRRKYFHNPKSSSSSSIFSCKPSILKPRIDNKTSINFSTIETNKQGIIQALEVENSVFKQQQRKSLSPSIDTLSIEDFNNDYENNLYKPRKSTPSKKLTELNKKFDQASEPSDQYSSEYLINTFNYDFQSASIASIRSVKSPFLPSMQSFIQQNSKTEPKSFGDERSLSDKLIERLLDDRLSIEKTVQANIDNTLRQNKQEEKQTDFSYITRQNYENLLKLEMRKARKEQEQLQEQKQKERNKEKQRKKREKHHEREFGHQESLSEWLRALEKDKKEQEKQANEKNKVSDLQSLSWRAFDKSLKRERKNPKASQESLSGWFQTLKQHKEKQTLSIKGKDKRQGFDDSSLSSQDSLSGRISFPPAPKHPKSSRPSEKTYKTRPKLHADSWLSFMQAEQEGKRQTSTKSPETRYRSQERKAKAKNIPRSVSEIQIKANQNENHLSSVKRRRAKSLERYKKLREPSSDSFALKHNHPKGEVLLPPFAWNPEEEAMENKRRKYLNQLRDLRNPERKPNRDKIYMIEKQKPNYREPRRFGRRLPRSISQVLMDSQRAKRIKFDNQKPKLSERSPVPRTGQPRQKALAMGQQKDTRKSSEFREKRSPDFEGFLNGPLVPQTRNFASKNFVQDMKKIIKPFVNMKNFFQFKFGPNVEEAKHQTERSDDESNDSNDEEKPKDKREDDSGRKKEQEDKSEKKEEDKEKNKRKDKPEEGENPEKEKEEKRREKRRDKDQVNPEDKAEDRAEKIQEDKRRDTRRNKLEDDEEDTTEAKTRSKRREQLQDKIEDKDKDNEKDKRRSRLLDKLKDKSEDKEDKRRSKRQEQLQDKIEDKDEDNEKDKRHSKKLDKMKDKPEDKENKPEEKGLSKSQNNPEEKDDNSEPKIRDKRQHKPKTEPVNGEEKDNLREEKSPRDRQSFMENIRHKQEHVINPNDQDDLLNRINGQKESLTVDKDKSDKADEQIKSEKNKYLKDQDMDVDGEKLDGSNSVGRKERISTKANETKTSVDKSNVVNKMTKHSLDKSSRKSKNDDGNNENENEHENENDDTNDMTNKNTNNYNINNKKDKDNNNNTDISLVGSGSINNGSHKANRKHRNNENEYNQYDSDDDNDHHHHRHHHHHGRTRKQEDKAQDPNTNEETSPSARDREKLPELERDKSVDVTLKRLNKPMKIVRDIEQDNDEGTANNDKEIKKSRGPRNNEYNYEGEMERTPRKRRQTLRKFGRTESANDLEKIVDDSPEDEGLASENDKELKPLAVTPTTQSLQTVREKLEMIPATESRPKRKEGSIEEIPERRKKRPNAEASVVSAPEPEVSDSKVSLATEQTVDITRFTKSTDQWVDLRRTLMNRQNSNRFDDLNDQDNANQEQTRESKRKSNPKRSLASHKSFADSNTSTSNSLEESDSQSVRTSESRKMSSVSLKNNVTRSPCFSSVAAEVLRKSRTENDSDLYRGVDKEKVEAIRKRFVSFMESKRQAATTSEEELEKKEPIMKRVGHLRSILHSNAEKQRSKRPYCQCRPKTSIGINANLSQSSLDDRPTSQTSLLLKTPSPTNKRKSSTASDAFRQSKSSHHDSVIHSSAKSAKAKSQTLENFFNIISSVYAKNIDPRHVHSIDSTEGKSGPASQLEKLEAIETASKQVDEALQKLNQIKTDFQIARKKMEDRKLQQKENGSIDGGSNTAFNKRTCEKSRKSQRQVNESKEIPRYNENQENIDVNTERKNMKSNAKSKNQSSKTSTMEMTRYSCQTPKKYKHSYVNTDINTADYSEDSADLPRITESESQKSSDESQSSMKSLNITNKQRQKPQLKNTDANSHQYSTSFDSLEPHKSSRSPINRQNQKINPNIDIKTKQTSQNEKRKNIETNNLQLINTDDILIRKLKRFSHQNIDTTPPCTTSESSIDEMKQIMKKYIAKYIDKKFNQSPNKNIDINNDEKTNKSQTIDIKNVKRRNLTNIDKKENQYRNFEDTNLKKSARKDKIDENIDVNTFDSKNNRDSFLDERFYIKPKYKKTSKKSHNDEASDSIDENIDVNTNPKDIDRNQISQNQQDIKPKYQKSSKKIIDDDIDDSIDENIDINNFGKNNDRHQIPQNHRYIKPKYKKSSGNNINNNIDENIDANTLDKQILQNHQNTKQKQRKSSSKFIGDDIDDSIDEENDVNTNDHNIDRRQNLKNYQNIKPKYRKSSNESIEHDIDANTDVNNNLFFKMQSTAVPDSLSNIYDHSHDTSSCSNIDEQSSMQNLVLMPINSSHSARIMPDPAPRTKRSLKHSKSNISVSSIDSNEVSSDSSGQRNSQRKRSKNEGTKRQKISSCGTGVYSSNYKDVKARATYQRDLSSTQRGLSTVACSEASLDNVSESISGISSKSSNLQASISDPFHKGLTKALVAKQNSLRRRQETVDYPRRSSRNKKEIQEKVYIENSDEWLANVLGMNSSTSSGMASRTRKAAFNVGKPVAKVESANTVLRKYQQEMYLRNLNKDKIEMRQHYGLTTSSMLSIRESIRNFAIRRNVNLSDSILDDDGDWNNEYSVYKEPGILVSLSSEYSDSNEDEPAKFRNLLRTIDIDVESRLTSTSDDIASITKLELLTAMSKKTGSAHDIQFIKNKEADLRAKEAMWLERKLHHRKQQEKQNFGSTDTLRAMLDAERKQRTLLLQVKERNSQKPLARVLKNIRPKKIKDADIDSNTKESKAQAVPEAQPTSETPVAQPPSKPQAKQAKPEVHRHSKLEPPTIVAEDPEPNMTADLKRPARLAADQKKRSK